MRRMLFHLGFLTTFGWAGAVEFDEVATVLEARCLDCHDGETREGGVDLERLLTAKEFRAKENHKVWLKVDRVVAAGEMPPKKKKPLTADEKAAVDDWFTSVFVLKDGHEHIGATPLRRLTRYELINTLEDLLHVQLKPPYVFSWEFPALLPSTLETLLPADAPGESGFTNDAAQLAGTQPPVLKLSAAFDFALKTFVQDAAAREKMFGMKTVPTDLPEAKARAILQRFVVRAWRGYRNADNEAVVWRAYQTRRKTAEPQAALLHAMKIGLLSPAFVYRMETVADRAAPYRVRAVELANRLSYFLWASMPDDELFALAASGALLKEPVLAAQVDRLLNSPKRLALAEEFAGQWLGFAAIADNRVFYRGESWTRGVYDEVLFFFDELVKSDRPILEVIDSDWIYQSNYTGVRTGGGGHKFEPKYADIFDWRRQRPGGIRERFYEPPRLIKINSDQRGGLITTVGILRVTSAPERTNPIRRGVWLLDKVLGRQLHAPENIPALSQSERVNGKKLADLADIMKAHTSKAICVSCHQHIDPLGLGLENFDPSGKWRTTYRNRRPVKSDGMFPNGKTFNTPRAMKGILLSEYREPIVKNFAERLLAYAIGRKLEPHDRPTVKRICAALKADGYKMSRLIRGVIASPQFQKRQDKP